MGYIPTNWVTGDTITAEKLNKAEEGIADAGCTLNIVAEHHGSVYGITQDATYIANAIAAGKLVYVTACTVIPTGETFPEFVGIVTEIVGEDSNVSVSVLTSRSSNPIRISFTASDWNSPLVYDPLG